MLLMEPQTGFEPAFAIQLPFSPFVAEGVTAALIIYGAGRGTRTPMVARCILSAVRLPISPYPHGGDKEARTPDLKLAKLLLYQLSYIPKSGTR